MTKEPGVGALFQDWLRRETDAAAGGWWWGKVREMRDTALRDIDRELDAVAVERLLERDG